MKKGIQKNLSEKGIQKNTFPTKPVTANIWIGISIVLGALLILSILGQVFGLIRFGQKDNIKEDDSSLSSPKALVIEEYADFQCPFCKKVLPTIEQLQKLYGDKIRFEFKHFPLAFHDKAQKAAEASECARDQGKFWEYHDKLFSSQPNLGVDNLKQYAVELGMDAQTFNACLDSGDKAALVRQQFSEGQEKGVSGTPGFVIGEKVISGALPIEQFIPIIDEALGEDSGHLDEIMADEPKVTVTVITCDDCSTTRILSATKGMFPKHAIETLYMNDPEAKELIETYQLEKVPSYLFTDNIIEAKSYKENQGISSAFQKIQDKYKLRDEMTGAERFIDPQKEAVYKARLAEEKRAAKEKLGIGEEPQIDFFVMSFCPYGNQAETAIEKVYQSMKDSVKFVPRYVIYEHYQGGGNKYCMDKDSLYCSMHGIQELHQDIRERCVFEDKGEESFFAFALAMNNKCTPQNADRCWEGVAKDLGLNVAKIKGCEQVKGETFMAEDKELNKLLNVRGSPTVFINGEAYNGPRTPAGYQEALCAAFGKDKPPSCNDIIEEAEPAPAPAGNCG